MRYDPREDGALCHLCSLGETLQKNKPVRSELRPGARLGICAEAPGGREKQIGRPLVGPSGKETMRALGSCGWTRGDVSLLNACSCQPPGRSMDDHLFHLRERNRTRAQRGLNALLPPAEACWPRFLRELHTLDAILLMGSVSRGIVYNHRILTEEELEDLRRQTKSVDGETGLMAARGYPDIIRLPGIEALGLEPKIIAAVSTIHAAFALRKKRWVLPFRWDVAKATRLATGQLRPFQPLVRLFPSNDQLLTFLSELDGYPAYDIETDLGPKTGSWLGERTLRCVGIGNEKDVMVVPYHSVQRDPEWLYSPAEKERRNRIVNAWFAGEIGKDPYKIAIDQNGIFDQTVLRHQHPGFRMGRARFDTVIAHHVAWSELPHDLGFQTSQYTDRPSHKDVDHSQWRGDRELHAYCGLDVATQSWNAQCLMKEPSLLAQPLAFQNDMFLSEFCRELHELGMKMDISERDRHYKLLTESSEQNLELAQELAVECVREAGWTKARESFARDLNPNSPDQLARFIYTDLGIAPLPRQAGGYTESGTPATGRDVLFSLTDRGVSDLIERFLLAVIDYREDIKLRGTYCSVQPCRDGRIRPFWNPHVAVSGRLSCKDPNLQNLRKALRTIYSREKGHILIAWDYAQLEARVTAILAGQMDQVEAFKAGADIHKVNACAVLGFGSVDEVDGSARQFTKTFVYAVQYLAGLQKVHQMIRNFRAKNGSRPYRDRPFSAIETMNDRFWKNRRAIAEFHRRNRDLQLQQGFLEDVVMGRRRYFLDAVQIEDEKEEKANYIIQSSAAAIVNRATKRLRDKFPPGFDGPNTGICQQGHDSLMLECREESWEVVAAEGCRTLDDELFGLPIPVDCEVGYSFGRLKEVSRESLGCPI